MSKKAKILDLEYNRHKCKSRRAGDWLIFECPQCSYVRKMNLVTKEMKVQGNEDMTVLHQGFHMPVGLQPEKYSPN